jgi:hypothetical protein
MANEKENELDPYLPDDRRQGPERQAGDGHPERRCRRCGEPVQGRRRNGYCGDACRMRDRRAEDERRRLELLDTISAAIEELRREVLR